MTTSAAPSCARTISAVCLAREKSDEQMTVSIGRLQPRAAASACWRPSSDSP
jgi:hypothetical protein